MKISKFMTPAADVVSCKPDDTLRHALTALTQNKVGAMVVMDYDEAEHIGIKPLGLLTKSDFADAYLKEIPLETPVKELMSQMLACLQETTTKDDAAKFLERERKHHAIVINHDGNFVGLISSWDVVADTAEEARAWPWNRFM